MIIGLDAYWIDKHARQLLRRFELFLPPLSPTLSKLHEGVSLSSSFLEFNFDHKFGCSFDEQVYKQTFETFQNIFTPFKHNEVSRLTNFSKLKFHHRFKSTFGK